MRVFGLIRPWNVLLTLSALCALTVLAPNYALAQVNGETVYRVKVTGGLDQVRARDYLTELESLGFLPVNLDFENDPVSVLYGNFPTREDAVRAKVDLQSQGFIASDILAFTRTMNVLPENGAPEAGFKVLIATYTDNAEAKAVREALEAKGFLFVESSTSADGLYFVTVGQYANKNDAQNLKAILLEEGYASAQVIGGDEADPLEIQARAAREAAEAAADAAAALAEPISPLITQTDLWQELSEDQKRRVLDTVLMQDEVRAGDTVAQKLLDLEKRIEGLDVRSKEVVRLVEEDRVAQRQMTIEVGRLYRDAESLARGGNYQEALVKLRQILQIDPEHQLAQTRIRIVEGFGKGERFEGQVEATRRSDEYHRSEARRLEDENTLESLRDAKRHWGDIATLYVSADPENPDQKFVSAQQAIKRIDDKIGKIPTGTSQAAQSSSTAKNDKLIYAISGFVFLLAGAFVFLLVRGQRQRKEFLMKIHEITSVRPPRSLEPAVAGGGSLPSGGSMGLDEPDEDVGGLFGGEESFGDPLASAATEEPPAAPVAEPPAGSEESIEVPSTAKEEEDITQPAGPATDSDATASEAFTGDDGTGSTDLDDLFGEDMGGSDPFSATDEAPTDPSVDVSAPDDDPFGAIGETGDDLTDLPSISETDFSAAADEIEAPAEAGDDFSIDDIFTDGGDAEPEPSPPEPSPSEPASTIDEISLAGSESDIAEISAISFDDIVAAETGSGTANPQSATSGTTSLSGMAGSAVETGSQGETSISDDPFAGTPFEELMGENDAKSGETAESPSLTVPADDSATSGTEEPASIEISFPNDDPFEDIKDSSPVAGPVAGAVAGVAAASAGVADTADTAPQPTGPEEPTSKPPTQGGSVVIAQDFSGDTVGQRPAGWEGEYPYATLTVKADDPPRGAKHYIAYEKSDGAGKAYFSMKFPNTSGVLSVEFDLRCNDKNKFLLGFYIEKDEDFQQSVHTKILRSETQTAPTIHLHGEPVPYMLGTWAHIRYVIDLTHGTVDGYIDSTHVARNLRLPQSPKFLNTLALRDNINTTGQLCIANIKVEQVS